MKGNKKGKDQCNVRWRFKRIICEWRSCWTSWIWKQKGKQCKCEINATADRDRECWRTIYENHGYSNLLQSWKKFLQKELATISQWKFPIPSEDGFADVLDKNTKCRTRSFLSKSLFSRVGNSKNGLSDCCSTDRWKKIPKWWLNIIAVYLTNPKSRPWKQRCSCCLVHNQFHSCENG